MAEFNFNEEQVNSSFRKENEQTSLIYRLLLKLDFIKNKDQATIAMICIIIILILISWFALSSMGDSTDDIPITTEIPETP